MSRAEMEICNAAAPIAANGRQAAKAEADGDSGLPSDLLPAVKEFDQLKWGRSEAQNARALNARVMLQEECDD